jgi:hypothetical protein
MVGVLLVAVVVFQMLQRRQVGSGYFSFFVSKLGRGKRRNQKEKSGMFG